MLINKKILIICLSLFIISSCDNIINKEKKEIKKVSNVQIEKKQNINQNLMKGNKISSIGRESIGKGNIGGGTTELE